MLNTIFKGLFDSSAMTVISISDYLLCVAVALALGAGIALTASRRSGLSHSFLAALAALPALVVRPAWATTWRWKSATRLAVGSVSRRQGCPSRGGIRRKPDVGGRI